MVGGLKWFFVECWEQWDLAGFLELHSVAEVARRFYVSGKLVRNTSDFVLIFLGCVLTCKVIDVGLVVCPGVIMATGKVSANNADEGGEKAGCTPQLWHVFLETTSSVANTVWDLSSVNNKILEGCRAGNCKGHVSQACISIEQKTTHHGVQPSCPLLSAA